MSTTSTKKMDSECDWNKQLLSIYKIHFKLNQTEFMRAIMRCKNGTSSPEQPANQPVSAKPTGTIWIIAWCDCCCRWWWWIWWNDGARSFISLHIISSIPSFCSLVRRFICLILIKREYTYVSIIIFIVLWNIIIANCNMAWWICACNLLGCF